MNSINTDQQKQDLLTYTVRLGDDAIVLGHRVSEWVSYAPFLEEDIALGNVALDYIGHARMYYSYAAELANQSLSEGEQEKTEDSFAYMRNEREYQNHLLNELPKGDFAYSVVRQLLLDIYNKYFYDALKQSSDETLVAIANKAAKETRYHCRRSHDWTLRLGDGTDESKQKMQVALDDIWGFTTELFEHDDVESRLIELGVAVDCAAFKENWLADVKAIVEQATLTLPTSEWAVRGGREGYHTEHLGHLLTELQFVHRSFPDAKW